MLVAAALGAGAIVVAGGSGDTVRLRQVVYDHVDRTVGEMQQLIRQNTR
ncbi:MAG: hypothetical protein LT070_12700 [Solirubrobacteraceae bacterium]|nr:hypothetical protein [Solirubrobacteraceae bacterium]